MLVVLFISAGLVQSHYATKRLGLPHVRRNHWKSMKGRKKKTHPWQAFIHSRCEISTSRAASNQLIRLKPVLPTPYMAYYIERSTSDKKRRRAIECAYTKTAWVVGGVGGLAELKGRKLLKARKKSCQDM